MARVQRERDPHRGHRKPKRCNVCKRSVGNAHEKSCPNYKGEKLEAKS